MEPRVLAQMNTEVAAWCSMLELTGVINEATVKAAYRKQVLLWHPDRHHDQPDARTMAERRLTLINRAFECLTEQLDEHGPLHVSTDRSPQHTWSAGERSTPRHVHRQRSFQPGFPDEAVIEVFVKSSNLLSIGYSKATQTLYIKFTDAAVYRYFDVPSSIFDSLLRADSHGSFAHRFIYQRFKSERCN